MPSVLEQIQWAHLPPPVNQVDSYMQGQAWRQQMDQGQRAGQIQQLQLERAKERTVQELAAAQSGKEYAANQAVLGSVNKLQAIAQQNPNMYGPAYKSEVTRLQQMLPPQFTRDLNPDAPLPAEQLGPIKQSVEQNLARLGAAAQKPAAFNADQVWAANRMAQLTGNAGMQNPMLASRADPQAFEKYRAEFNAMQEKNAKAKGTNVTVSNDIAGMTAPVRGKVEEDVYNADKLMSRLDDIESLGDPAQYLGVMNKIDFTKKNIQDQLGVLSPTDRAGYDKAVAFRSAVGEYKSGELHKLLGGAQTPTEISNTVDFMLSTSMSPEQFRTALGRLRASAQRARAVSSGILEQGGFKVGTAKYDNEFHKQYEERKASDLQTRAAQLEAQGVTPQQAAAQLQSEGLL